MSCSSILVIGSFQLNHNGFDDKMIFWQNDFMFKNPHFDIFFEEKNLFYFFIFVLFYVHCTLTLNFNFLEFLKKVQFIYGLTIRWICFIYLNDTEVRYVFSCYKAYKISSCGIRDVRKLNKIFV